MTITTRTFATILGAAFLVAAAGLASHVYLGDESYHFMFARGIYETGTRVTVNAAYQDYPRLGYFYGDVPFWHVLLAFLWWLWGSPSAVIAQIYQACYVLLLGFSVYGLTTRLYGHTEGFRATLLIVTAPLVAAFSILLYLDVPVAAWAALALWMLHDRRWIPAGLAAGAMILTKISGLLLLPAFAVLVFFFSGPGLLKKTKAMALTAIPAIAINLPELIFRKNHFGYIYYVAPRYIPRDGPSMVVFEPSSLYVQPWNLVLYFGVPILIGLVLYLTKRLWQRDDMVLWLPVIVYLLFFPVLFRYSLPVRNLSPILPALSILAAKGIASLNWNKLRAAFAFLCLFQFLATAGNVYVRRQAPQGIREAFGFVGSHTPPKAVFLYPEENLVLYTGRPIVWSHITEMATLFWKADGEQMRTILGGYDVNYVAIKKDRVYDDRAIRHTGGYPASFVERLSRQPFAKQVFDNSAVTIWQVGN